MRTYITSLMLVVTLGLVSCGGGNDVASSGASAVSAAAPASNASPASAPSTAATEPKVNGQIDERTGVAPVVAKMTISGSVNYYTDPSGNYYNGFYGPSRVGTLCSKGEVSAKGAIVVCLNRPEQFANYTINGVDYYTQFDASKNAYTAWLASYKAFCGHGDSPNAAIQWCLGR